MPYNIMLWGGFAASMYMMGRQVLVRWFFGSPRTNADDVLQGKKTWY